VWIFDLCVLALCILWAKKNFKIKNDYKSPIFKGVLLRAILITPISLFFRKD
jgi:hypothetical protein